MNKVLTPLGISYVKWKSGYFITGRIKIIEDLPILTSESATAVSTTLPKGIIFEREYAELNTDNETSEVIEIGDRNHPRASDALMKLEGIVVDKDTGEPLVGATISLDEEIKSVTNEKGFYSIQLNKGVHTIGVRFIGMKEIARNIALFSHGTMDFSMAVDVKALREITVVSNQAQNVERSLISVNRIDMEEVKNVPLLMGERDVLKVVTTFAGVQTVGEGSGGFNVRGGKSDQNLILLDGATIYNASHFLGFFSIFNSDAIQSLDIYKGTIPPHMGGRLSSVLDIQSKAANQEKIAAVGGISFITSKLGLEIPVVKDKAGLMLSGRFTYSDWVLNRIDSRDFRNNDVNFNDILFRYDHEITPKDDIAITGYFSKDQFSLSSDTLFSFSTFAYQNRAGAATWNHTFNQRFNSSVTATHSYYGYDLTIDDSEPNAFTQDFHLSESALNGRFQYVIDDKYTLETGLNVKRYSVNPGSRLPLGEESVISPKELPLDKGVESAAYVSGEFHLSKRLTLFSGLRYSRFVKFGPGIVARYDPNAPRNNESIVSTEVFGDGEKIQTYHGPEPRLSITHKFCNSSSLKAGYNRTRQYLHTLTNTASISPTDIWKMSGVHIQPQIADQFSLGYYRNFRNDQIETSIDVFYKNIENLLDFKVGADFLLNEYVESAILQGPGKSYGLELEVKKSGRLNGWINYTFSRTFLKLLGDFPEETVNDGAFYPANYDIPHAVNLVMNYKVTKRWSFSYNLKFNSGRPVTYPVAVYSFKDTQSILFTDRNQDRLPHYLRMDIGINLEAGHKIKKLAHSYWTFSVYNVLGRKNVYSVFFDISDGELQGYELLIFDRPIPTITYNFRI